jgi:hypothetical protein
VPVLLQCKVQCIPTLLVCAGPRAQGHRVQLANSNASKPIQFLSYTCEQDPDLPASHVSFVSGVLYLVLL